MLLACPPLLLSPLRRCLRALNLPSATLQINAVKKGVRFRPPEVAAGLQRLELAREHLAVRLQLCSRAHFAG